MLPRVLRRWGSAVLAGGEDADQVHLQQIVERLDGEAVDRLVRGVLTGVVDEAVQASQACDGTLDNALKLVGLTHVARLEMAGSRAGRGQFSGERAAAFLVNVADDDACAGAHKDACAARANALAAAGNQGGLVKSVGERGCVLRHLLRPVSKEWLTAAAH